MYIIGAGGHAKVVIDILEKQGEYPITGLLDDDPTKYGKEYFGYQVLTDWKFIREPGQTGLLCLVAIGNNDVRQKISSELVAHGATLVIAIHPSAQISRNVTLSQGTVVMAGCVINADSMIGSNVIVNSRASIDNDCVVEDAVHIAPGVTLCGGVKIGFGSLIGAGTIIVPGIHVGTNVVVGAGSVVVSDIDDRQVVVGNPAKPI